LCSPSAGEITKLGIAKAVVHHASNGITCHVNAIAAAVFVVNRQLKGGSLMNCDVVLSWFNHNATSVSLMIISLDRA
jgi:hypothetical protein